MVRFTVVIKKDAIKQITERGHSVADVSRRFGVSTHSLHAWMKRYLSPDNADGKDDQSADIRRLKNKPAHVTEERDTLKKATAYLAKGAKLSTPLSRSIARSLHFEPCAGRYVCTQLVSIIRSANALTMKCCHPQTLKMPAKAKPARSLENAWPCDFSHFSLRTVAAKTRRPIRT